jgi:hypothetical protein
MMYMQTYMGLPYAAGGIPGQMYNNTAGYPAQQSAAIASKAPYNAQNPNKVRDPLPFFLSCFTWQFLTRATETTAIRELPSNRLWQSAIQPTRNSIRSQPGFPSLMISPDMHDMTSYLPQLASGFLQGSRRTNPGFPRQLRFQLHRRAHVCPL